MSGLEKQTNVCGANKGMAMKITKTPASQLQAVIETMDTLDVGWWMVGDVATWGDCEMRIICKTENNEHFCFALGREIDVMAVDAPDSIGGVFHDKLTECVRSQHDAITKA